MRHFAQACTQLRARGRQAEDRHAAPRGGPGGDLKNENYLTARACVHLRVFTRTVELGRSAGIVKFNVVRSKRHGYMSVTSQCGNSPLLGRERSRSCCGQE